MSYKKKLIEVALPLDAINAESAREKSIRHGHPSTLHLWWARRPLAACRAVLFAQMVDDPSAHPDRFPTEEAQQQERERLFRIIEELVKWENINNETVLEAARAEIRRCAPPEGLPPVLDPFAGGGSIPLEAQRLGLEAHASDLNPVAVLINKALIEIPPKFAGQPPVNPDAQRTKSGQMRAISEWKGAAGLAEDVLYYGQWMRNEAERRIGHLYPKVRLPNGDEATVIAWLWARTVTCPNPACGAQMPLVSSYWLSKRTGHRAWVEPVVDRSQLPSRVHFQVRTGSGSPSDAPKVGRGARFRCLACGQITGDQYIKDEGISGRIGAQLVAIVAEGDRGRIFLSPSMEHERLAKEVTPLWEPNELLPDEPRAFTCVLYGLTTYGKLYTPRQLTALTTFSELVQEAREQIKRDAKNAGVGPERTEAYSDAVATYLGLAVSKAADLASVLCWWQPNPEHLKLAPTFSRHALPMSWDYAEGNPFSHSSGNFARQWELISKVLIELVPSHAGYVHQQNAASSFQFRVAPVVSTDPPYYDNVPYANLSDFFYIWLKKSLSNLYPELFSTLLVPKAEELVADSTRHSTRDKARSFFEEGLHQVFLNLRTCASSEYPLTVYYAFKQTETDDLNEESHAVSTGWQAMLQGLISAGFAVNGTWPVRTERPGRLREMDSNALASSIVLVCRLRPDSAGIISRRDFLTILKREIPNALRNLQQGNIAPVDLAQASIGPGMAIYSRYSKVVEADGSAMSVRTALALINQALDEYLTEQESDYDADTRWALAWYEQHGFDEGVFGDAETLSRAKGTSVQGMVGAGFLYARAGKVRLLRREELDSDWNPTQDKRLTVWELTQHLIRALEQRGVESAANMLAMVGPLGDVARELAYRLYTLCERKGWAQEALAYNGLVISWNDVGKQAAEIATASPVQGRLGLS